MSETVLKTCNSCGRQFCSPEDFMNNTSRWRICDMGHLWFNCSCLSTGIIIKGKFDWYSPSTQLSGNAQSVFHQISKVTELPRLPNYVMELQKLLENPTASAQQMANLLKYDSMLSATVLRVANTQKVNDGRAIRNLSHAIAYVGIPSLRDMVTLAAVSRFELKTRLFSAKEYWDKSFLTGRIAEYLTRTFHLEIPVEQAFLCGSTCNIGKIVQAMIDPKLVDLYTAEMQDLMILGTWNDAERRHKGFQHTVLGEIGAAFWGLPEELLDAICLHHNKPREDKKDLPVQAWEVAGLANQLAHWVCLEPHLIDQSLLEAFLQRFGLKILAVEKMMDDLLPLREISKGA